MYGVVDALAEKGWSVVPGFLAPDLTRALAQEAESLHAAGRLQAAGTGQGEARAVRPSVRGDAIHWLEPAAATRAQRDYLDRMEALRLAVNRGLQLGLFDLEAHFARYPAGAGYRRHVDVFQADDRRTLSVICYLNEDWRKQDGGALRLHPKSGPAVDILPAGGTLACFLSAAMAHEVRPATRPRLSLTGWFRRR